jgi:hypothetical protein
MLTGLRPVPRKMPPKRSAINSFRGRECAWLLCYALAAPLLLFAAALTIARSSMTRALFGNDPAAALLEQHPEAWIILNLTGRCTLCLLFVALLLRYAS